MTHYLRAALLALACCTFDVSALAAQRISPVGAQPVGIGSRVRVYAPSLRRERYVGRIDSLTATDMTLDTTGVRRRLGFEMGPVLVDSYRLVTLRTSAIDKIEVSAGRTTRGATIKGAIIGGLVGALLVGFGQMPEVNPKASDFFKAAPVGLVVGAIGGGIVGYALGGERWVPGELAR